MDGRERAVRPSREEREGDMKIGFTGTRNGLTDAQDRALACLLFQLRQDNHIEEAHSGGGPK
jgi:hypothetical protein